MLANNVYVQVPYPDLVITMKAATGDCVVVRRCKITITCQIFAARCVLSLHLLCACVHGVIM